MKKIYIFLGLVMSIPLAGAFAQAPGGVSANLTLWMQSIAGTSTTTNGAALTQWNSVNDPVNKFFTGGGGAANPVFPPSVINSLPGVTFAGAQLMDGQTGALAPITAGNDAYSIFAVWETNSSTTIQRVWSQRNSVFTAGNGGGLWLFGSGTPLYGDQAELNPFTQGAIVPFTANTWNISQVNLLSQATNDLQVIDQTNLTTGGATASTFDPGGTPSNDGAGQRNIDNALNRMGARNAAGDEPFNGNLAELIVFDRPISGAERSQIFSYLSMKYGIPTGANLVTSTGATVWDATANAAYNNSVFGIGEDDASGLLVAASNSANSGNGNGTGKSGQGNIIVGNASTLANGNFLMIGNDGASLAETGTNIPVVAAGSMRVGRSWRVQQTGASINNVGVSFDLNGLTVTGNPATLSDFRLVVDMDGDGNFTTGTQAYYTPVSSAGNILVFNGVSLGNNNVFTVLTSTTGAVPLPVIWEDFSAVAVNQDVDLKWDVGNNQNANIYKIESSDDGTAFTPIGTVDNAAGVLSYSYVDNNVVAGTHFYRIDEVDLDGKSILSKIVSVTIKDAPITLHVRNNPAVAGPTQLEINSSTAAKASIELFTMTGSRISARMQTLAAGQTLIELPMKNLSAAQYFLKVTVNGAVYSVKLTKL
jgi:hypothetical protein